MLLKLQNNFLEFIYNNDKSILELIPYEHDEAIFRLAIYKNNVISNLIDSLKLAYHLILAILGENIFEQLAKDYIASHKPNSGNLDDYGDRFSKFLQKYNKLEENLFYSDLAKYEWLRNIIYSYEDQDSLPLGALEKIAEDQYSQLKFIFNRSINLMKSQYNVANIIKQKNTNIKQEQSYIIIYRLNHFIKTTEISKSTWHFYRALIARKNLITSYNIATRHDKNFDLSKALQNMLIEKMIYQIITSTKA